MPNVVPMGCIGLWKHSGVLSELEKLGKLEICVMLRVSTSSRVQRKSFLQLAIRAS